MYVDAKLNKCQNPNGTHVLVANRLTTWFGYAYLKSEDSEYLCVESGKKVTDIYV